MTHVEQIATAVKILAAARHAETELCDAVAKMSYLVADLGIRPAAMDALAAALAAVRTAHVQIDLLVQRIP